MISDNTQKYQKYWDFMNYVNQDKVETLTKKD